MICRPVLMEKAASAAFSIFVRQNQWTAGCDVPCRSQRLNRFAMANAVSSGSGSLRLLRITTVNACSG